jgi:hypothetical protein
VKEWESYEAVAACLLDRFADEFGLVRVEGKQRVVGERSGTTWEIDAKGFREGDVGFVIVECRRHTTSRQSQERIGALAYRIIDAGADGGIIVSPLGLQEGAARIAGAENIVSVHLDETSTTDEYIMRFLKKVMIGLQDTVHFTDSLEIKVCDREGKVVRRINPK